MEVPIEFVFVDIECSHFSVINPRLKLRWFEENAPHGVRQAKRVILSAVSTLSEGAHSFAAHRFKAGAVQHW